MMDWMFCRFSTERYLKWEGRSLIHEGTDGEMDRDQIVGGIGMKGCFYADYALETEKNLISNESNFAILGSFSFSKWLHIVFFPLVLVDEAELKASFFIFFGLSLKFLRNNVLIFKINAQISPLFKVPVSLW